MMPLDPALAEELAVALAAGPAQLFAVLSALFTALPGVRTFTFLATAPDKSVTHRIGTSDPANFPIGGFDPIDDSPWNRRILVEQRPVVGDTPELMAEFIPETAQLVAMGYGAVLCAPVVIAGETRGVACALGDAGILTPQLLREVEQLLPIAALAFTFEGISER